MDSQVFEIISKEAKRQSNTIELIASENHVSSAVTEAVGSCFTNKYAEGYPGKRYYFGCDNYDEMEILAQERAKKLFNCNFANVQPHSGASANIAAFLAFMNPGDVYASLVLSDGGHLSHGLKINISGKYFEPVHYPLIYDENNPNFETIDYDAVREVCLEHKPKMLLCGYSAYPRIINFELMRKIADECGAILMCDIAHIAGLVAGGAHPSPFPHAHIVTTTTHKTLRGPRGGMILSNDEEIAVKIDRAVFPGSQGGPLMHMVAGKAVAFGEALKPSFKLYAQAIIDNAKVLAETLAAGGLDIVSGGTDTHLVLVDLRPKALTGDVAEKALERAGLTCNKNGIPYDPEKPMVTSGVRLGTPAGTTRGFGQAEFRTVGQLIVEVLDGLASTGEIGNKVVETSVRERVDALCMRFPIYPNEF